MYYSETQDVGEEDKFPCHLCSYVSVTKMSLIRHMISQHEDEDQEPVVVVKKEAPPPPLKEEPPTLSIGAPGLINSSMLESLLKNGKPSASRVQTHLLNGGSMTNGHSTLAASPRPIPDLKPLLSSAENLARNNSNGMNLGKNFKCQQCGVSFRKKEDLSRHVTRTHGNSKFTCPYCSRNISRRDHLKRHIKNVHPEFCTATEVGPFLNQGAGRPSRQQQDHQRHVVHDTPSSNNRRVKQEPATATFADEAFQDQEDQSYDSLNLNINMINESKIQLPNMSMNGLKRSSPTSQQQQQQPQWIDYSNLRGSTDEEEDYQEQEDDEDGMVVVTEDSNTEDNYGAASGEDENDEFAQSESMTFGDGGDAEMEEDYDNTYDEPLDFSDDIKVKYDEDPEGESNQQADVDGLIKIQVTERKFKCDLCEAAFMSKINMQRHMATHSISRPHKCSVCGKGFLRKEHLTKHLSSVHSGLKYRCQFCRKDISRKDHLLRHIRNCHPQEFMGMSLDMIDSEPQIAQVPSVTLSNNPGVRLAALSCDLCSEIFNHIDELNEHQSDVHSDIRKFKCDQCPKAFKRKEHLLKHQSTHATAASKTYTCSECNKIFANLESAHNHVQKVHGATKKPSTSNGMEGGQSFLCNLCDNSFQQRGHLLQHLKAYHGVSNPERRFGQSQIDLTPKSPPAYMNGNNRMNGSGGAVQPYPPPPKPQKHKTAMMRTPAPTNQNQTSAKHDVNMNSALQSLSQLMEGAQAQINSLLGLNSTSVMETGEGSLGNLMGLINRGSISLSLSNRTGA